MESESAPKASSANCEKSEAFERSGVGPRHALHRGKCDLVGLTAMQSEPAGWVDGLIYSEDGWPASPAPSALPKVCVNSE